MYFHRICYNCLLLNGKKNQNLANVIDMGNDDTQRENFINNQLLIIFNNFF